MNQQSYSPNDVITTGEAAKLLGVSAKTIGKLMDKKELVGYRIGAHRRLIMRDIEAYCARNNIPIKVQIVGEELQRVQLATALGMSSKCSWRELLSKVIFLKATVQTGEI